MIKLTYSPGTIASASAIALEESGLPWDPVRVDFTAAEQRQKRRVGVAQEERPESGPPHRGCRGLPGVRDGVRCRHQHAQPA